MVLHSQYAGKEIPHANSRTEHCETVADADRRSKQSHSAMYSPSRRSDTYRRHRAHSLAGRPCCRHANPASPESGLARKHDETYKLIFSQQAAVEELVRNFVGKRLADELDFDTLEPLPTNRISGGLVQRQLDLLCKVRFRGGWLYLLILLEFQSENDPFMALRILTYTCLTYEELIRRGEVRPGNKLPPLLPVTVYNGRPRWRAATDVAELIAPVTEPLARYLPNFRYLLLDLQRIGGRDPGSRDLVTSLGIVERDPTPENLQRVMRGLIRRFRGPEFAGLHEALYSWVAGAAEAWQISEANLARLTSFTEDEEMYERAKELRDQVHRDGVRQGLEQGRIRERALVRRLATRKFGAETAERLTRILEDRADADRLDEVFEAIIDCGSGAELFARVRA